MLEVVKGIGNAKGNQNRIHKHDATNRDQGLSCLLHVDLKHELLTLLVVLLLVGQFEVKGFAFDLVLRLCEDELVPRAEALLLIEILGLLDLGFDVLEIADLLEKHLRQLVPVGKSQQILVDQIEQALVLNLVSVYHRGEVPYVVQ